MYLVDCWGGVKHPVNLLSLSHCTDSDYLDTLSMSSSVYGEKARESGSMLGTVMEDQSSLASSLSHVSYSVPLSIYCTHV